jgi:hypothetical protein
MTAPSAQEVAAADYGQPMTQEAAQAAVLSFMAMTLKDPDSAHYQWGQVGPGWIKDAPFFGGRTHYGYTIFVVVNARNSFGAYAGPTKYQFLMRDGRIEAAMKQGRDGVPEKIL